MRALRLGLLGAGFAGRTLAAAAVVVPSVEVTAVWSPTPARRDELAATRGAVAMADPEAVIRAVDAVVVTTPHQTHAGFAGTALAAGRHVLCEKPLSTKTRAGAQLIKEANARGLVLSVNHFQRYRRPNVAARQVIAAGRLGAVLGGQCRLLEAPMTHPWQHESASVGFLLGYGVHAVDLLRWWLADDVVEVSARQATDGAGIERTTVASLRFGSGAVVALTTSDQAAPSGREQVGRAAFGTQLAGETGLLDVDSYGATVLSTPEAEVIDYLPSWTAFDSPERLEAYARALSQFAEACLTGAAPALTAQDALSAVQVCLAAGESARRGGEPVCVLRQSRA